MKGRVTYCIVTIAAMILSQSCRKEIIVPQDEENARDFITFYVKSTPTAATKALIEDTDDLIAQAPPIYVTDLSDNSPAFDNESVSHSGSGIWRSDKTWNESKTYSFSAYVASPSPNSTATDSRGGLTIDKNGGLVTISQPKNYSTDKNVWADYLLSYRLNVNGADRPVVALELERVTTAVELYMTRSANMVDVIVDRIEFRNVATSSRFSLDYQATPDDTEGPGGSQGLYVTGPWSGELSARGGTLTLMDNKERWICEYPYSGSPNDLLQYLRITELMYHPLPNPPPPVFPTLFSRPCAPLTYPQKPLHTPCTAMPPPADPPVCR